MDLDAFVTVHRPQWDRLDVLSRRARLTGEEADELVELYQRAATHLSMIRSASPDAELMARLSTTVARARSTVAGGQEPLVREVARFVTVSFPAAVWRSRWWTLASAVFTTVVALLTGAWVAGNPGVQTAVFGSDARIRQLVESDFAGYYSEFAASSFAFRVWTNNAWVAAVCVALGVTGVGVVFMLWQNAVNIGLIGGVMAANGRLDLFFGLITPHGLLELTAVFVAAGAGLQLFWAWVSPGARSRADAMADEGRSMVTVAVGLVVVLLVSGVIEAFVTPSPLSTAARIAIGALAWLTFLAYVGWYGRRAARAGELGDLRAELVEDRAPVAG